MKKNPLLIILTVFLILIFGFFGGLTAFSIFDSWVVQYFDVSLRLDTFAPDVIVYIPGNVSYNTSTLNLAYFANDSFSNMSSVWYNLDGGVNYTLSSNITINASRGSHTLFIYANDTSGLVNSTERVDFSVAYLLFNYTRFNATTTDYSALPDNQLSSVCNATLEIADFGKIQFNECIDILYDTDFDSYVDINFNTAFLNSGPLFYFNRSATVWLYNLTFDDPRVLIDGNVCPASYCTLDSYSGGTLRFDVSGFSNFSAEETPVTPPGTPSGGGGGGGSGKVTYKVGEFELDKDLLKVKVRKGEVSESSLFLKNTGDTELDVYVQIKDIDDLVTTSDKLFKVGLGQEKLINFKVGSIRVPGIYTGKIVFKSGDLIEEVGVIVEIESGELLDVNFKVPDQFKIINAGDEIFAQVEIKNFGNGKIEVPVVLGIKNLENELLFSKESSMVVETEASGIWSFDVPDYFAPGVYVAYLLVNYQDTVATASDSFEVSRKELDLAKAKLTLDVLTNRVKFILGMILLIVLFVWTAMLILYNEEIGEWVNTKFGKKKKVQKVVKSVKKEKEVKVKKEKLPEVKSKSVKKVEVSDKELTAADVLERIKSRKLKAKKK